MNERIKKLAEQAGIPSLWTVGTDKQGNPILEKFSELMIEEACQAFWSEACNVSDLAYEDYHRNSKKIRQHFGVEL